ncbi:MAG: hypothetical protein ACI9Y7_002176, partial [Dokdonia sp.]
SSFPPIGISVPFAMIIIFNSLQKYTNCSIKMIYL